ncbi:MAG: hypothetical protein EA409_12345, partial [Saprospirales bacterium]
VVELLSPSDTTKFLNVVEPIFLNAKSLKAGKGLLKFQNVMSLKLCFHYSIDCFDNHHHSSLLFISLI